MNNTIKMPPKTTYYPEPSIDGLYQIQPACNNVHAFTIDNNNFTKIMVVNAEPNTQDMSMRGWISDTPMGQMLFFDKDARIVPFNIPKMYSFDNINIPTMGLEIKIYDITNPQFKNENLKLYPNIVYFVCVQNIQNKLNAYRLVFSNIDIPKNYDDQTSNGSGFSCSVDHDSSDGNFRYNNNCSCSCHVDKKAGRPSKKPCHICGCLPNNFVR